MDHNSEYWSNPSNFPYFSIIYYIVLQHIKQNKHDHKYEGKALLDLTLKAHLDNEATYQQISCNKYHQTVKLHGHGGAESQLKFARIRDYSYFFSNR